MSAADKSADFHDVQALQQCVKTQIISTNIVGERLHQHESSAGVIVSPDRHTASAFIASTTRTLKKANPASGLPNQGDDDSGDPSANVSSGNATPAAAKAYRLSLRLKYDDVPDIVINATRLATNGRVHKSDTGLYLRGCCQAIQLLIFHRLLFLHLSTTVLQHSLHCERTFHIVADVPVFLRPS